MPVGMLLLFLQFFSTLGYFLPIFQACNPRIHERHFAAIKHKIKEKDGAVSFDEYTDSPLMCFSTYLGVWGGGS